MWGEVNPEDMVLQSTSLLRGKTSLPRKSPEIRSCFNPLPSCEGRPVLRIYLYKYIIASIHFPLAREDTLRDLLLPWRSRFNPLPSCEGRLNNRLGTSYSSIASIHFPLAREDVPEAEVRRKGICFNPLPSCEGRPSSNTELFVHLLLQSTSLLRGKTLYRLTFLPSKVLQSTSLLRGKTNQAACFKYHKYASIHFPLAREDI